jgi:hypothetical protein
MKEIRPQLSRGPLCSSSLVDQHGRPTAADHAIKQNFKDHTVLLHHNCLHQLTRQAQCARRLMTLRTALAGAMLKRRWPSIRSIGLDTAEAAGVGMQHQAGCYADSNR